jgi:hypothetical protein
MLSISKKDAEGTPIAECPADGPAVRLKAGAKGDLTYTCAGCSRIILEDVTPGLVQNLIFHCTVCGTYNAMPPSPSIFRR